MGADGTHGRGGYAGLLRLPTIGSDGDNRLRRVTPSRAPPSSLPDRATDALRARYMPEGFSPTPGHPHPFRPSGGPPLGAGEVTYCTTL
jgi:hypothetical protein